MKNGQLSGSLFPCAVKAAPMRVLVQFDVEAALRRHLASQNHRYHIKLYHYQDGG
jgi:hypothetical protein